MRIVLVLSLLLSSQTGLATVRVANYAAAQKAGLQILPVQLTGAEGGLALQFSFAPAADALFLSTGKKISASKTFSSSNGPAFKIGKDAATASNDLYARILSGDSSRYGARDGLAKDAWKRPEGIGMARALREQETLKRWTEAESGIVVPVVETGWTADEESDEALPYVVFSVPRRGKIISGKTVVSELNKPERYETLIELLDTLPGLTDKLADQGIFAPKLDPTAVIIDRSRKTHEARLIKVRFDDRDAEIAQYMEESGYADQIGELISDPRELREFYGERAELMRAQGRILEDRRLGKTLYTGGRAEEPAEIARLLLHATDTGAQVRWEYKSKPDKPGRKGTVTMDPDGLKYSDWLKGFVTIQGFGPLRRISRVVWAELVD